MPLIGKLAYHRVGLLGATASLLCLGVAAQAEEFIFSGEFEATSVSSSGTFNTHPVVAVGDSFTFGFMYDDSSVFTNVVSGSVFFNSFDGMVFESDPGNSTNQLEPSTFTRIFAQREVNGSGQVRDSIRFRSNLLLPSRADVGDGDFDSSLGFFEVEFAQGFGANGVFVDDPATGLSLRDLLGGDLVLAEFEQVSVDFLIEDFGTGDPMILGDQDITGALSSLSVVPEPSSLALIGIAGMTLLRRRR